MVKNNYLPFKARILAKYQQTELDWTYRLECQAEPVSGQFMEVSLPGVGECPISISDFGEGYIEMTIRRVGKVTEGIDKLAPGDYLFLRGPYGNGFPLESFYDKHLIIAAGGTGLAPVKSVINHFYAQPELLKRCEILTGFKTPTDVLFKSDLEKWSQTFRVEVTVDKLDEFGNLEVIADSCTRRTGLITSLIPDVQIPSLEDVRVIIVGPPVMMKFTAQEFLCRGLAKENIWVSFERKMSCGLGKCGHCKIDETYVCLEGPVFNFTKAQTLLD
ncbi:sulfite reductase, subunit B [Desulfosporosinus acidiphilus SJ4]|uniref:Sulfite reductase, subunit B n=1 Tax=Desulfosporosinus acidiphilus (strain DSM 22704 / JCM 16185 / SJ4) TaxID=646529 RepID=I4D0Z9_DESAJ|nr:anaerobic sulfite reductase subunit AsrB [Desulfosporosinus acidiphilus]AFM39473.1 sulfite reductase, subunit B [Desulfosporosinus acidiphilus SJ4]